MNNNIKKVRKKSRSSRNISNANNETEMFVLSPDILNKLGINLDGIIDEDKSNVDKNDTEANLNLKCDLIISNNLQISDNKTLAVEDTSITKTANLMKESVFLSPTFNCSTSISGELEISNEFHESVTNISRELKIANDYNKPEISSCGELGIANELHEQHTRNSGELKTDFEFHKPNNKIPVESKTANKLHSPETSTERELAIVNQLYESEITNKYNESQTSISSSVSELFDVVNEHHEVKNCISEESEIGNDHRESETTCVGKEVEIVNKHGEVVDIAISAELEIANAFHEAEDSICRKSAVASTCQNSDTSVSGEVAIADELYEQIYEAIETTELKISENKNLNESSIELITISDLIGSNNQKDLCSGTFNLLTLIDPNNICVEEDNLFNKTITHNQTNLDSTVNYLESSKLFFESSFEDNNNIKNSANIDQPRQNSPGDDNTQKSHKKITIISQEIIDTSKVHQYKETLNINKDRLVFVEANTFALKSDEILPKISALTYNEFDEIDKDKLLHNKDVDSVETNNKVDYINMNLSNFEKSKTLHHNVIHDGEFKNKIHDVQDDYFIDPSQCKSMENVQQYNNLEQDLNPTRIEQPINKKDDDKFDKLQNKEKKDNKSVTLSEISDKSKCDKISTNLTTQKEIDLKNIVTNSVLYNNRSGNSLITYFNKTNKRNKRVFEDLLKTDEKSVKKTHKLTKSKPSIQGVEKPGGSKGNIYSYQCKKTYPKTDIREKNNDSECILTDSDFFQNNVICENFYVTQEFCHCNDFGKLVHIDYDAKWYFPIENVKEIVSSIKDIKNIFVENVLITSSTIDSSLVMNSSSHNICSLTLREEGSMASIDLRILEDKVSESSITPMTDFISDNEEQTCYNEKDDNFMIYHDNYYSKIVEYCTRADGSKNDVFNEDELNCLEEIMCEPQKEMTPENKERKRRCRELRALIKEEPLPKKNVKCGVCKVVLAESEWETHLDTVHSFIAWREGDSFDPHDSNLFLKLKEKVSKGESLTCSFCSTKLHCENKFIIHIKQCWEQDNAKSLDDGKTIDKRKIKCGTCAQEMCENAWTEHLQTVHNYLAWKDGETPINLNDEEAVFTHLYNVTKEYGQLTLTCFKCGVKRKQVKSYLQHVKNCDSNTISVNITLDSIEENTNNTSNNCGGMVLETEAQDTEKCGVCHKNVEDKNWLQHIEVEHNYLAWRSGQEPINLDDNEEVYRCLYEISKQVGKLKCSKCNFEGTYVKPFMAHIKKCDLKIPPKTTSDKQSKRTVASRSSQESSVDSNTVKCGVCRKKIDKGLWVQHLAKEHNYLSWKDGETPVDLDDQEDVKKHLYNTLKIYDGLICGKCGLLRKYVKGYLKHINTCAVNDEVVELEIIPDTSQEEKVECAICSEKVPLKNWKKHALHKHYNLAWYVGEEPLDVMNIPLIERCLKEYKQYAKNLICKICRISRVSYHGFYAHIIVCGKTDEETEMYKSVCEICKGKYLFIYRNQHMTMHREQDLKKNKLLNESEKASPVVSALRKRKAAENALNLIENQEDHLNQFNCSSCAFVSDDETKFSKHVCKKVKTELVNVEADHVRNASEYEANSDESDDIKEYRKKRKSQPVSSQPTLPFEVKNVDEFLNKCANDFEDFHFTNDTLFPEWCDIAYNIVSDDKAHRYLPNLEESCCFRIPEDSKWKSLKRFTSLDYKDGSVLFAGACVSCMSWAPAGGGDVECAEGAEGAGGVKGAGGAQLLALATHAAADAPRLAPTHTAPHHALLQIWDFQGFDTSPELSYGIALNYGTVWAMDWCPSGARHNYLESNIHSNRLGLLAVACSNGSAYIFSVPYPSVIFHSCAELTEPIIKLKPVAELRLSSSETRTKYQATSLCWSKQRGHTEIVVGYADGTIAYYKLDVISSLLRASETGVDLFYPYKDERPHNVTVLSLDMYPGERSASVCSASLAGASVGCAGSAGVARTHTHVACDAVNFLPHWPSALIAGEDSIVTGTVVNELQYCGAGRRAGPLRAAAACWRCARVAAAAPPLVRLLRLHPAHSDLNKQPLCMIHMVPLDGRKRKQTNDELCMKLEPLTYEDTVKKYGIEFKFTKDFQKFREPYPERFPLDDMPALSFCRSRRHHHQLAVATHSGLVFVIRT